MVSPQMFKNQRAVIFGSEVAVVTVAAGCWCHMCMLSQHCLLFPVNMIHVRDLALLPHTNGITYQHPQAYMIIFWCGQASCHIPPKYMKNGLNHENKFSQESCSIYKQEVVPRSLSEQQWILTDIILSPGVTTCVSGTAHLVILHLL